MIKAGLIQMELLKKNIFSYEKRLAFKNSDNLFVKKNLNRTVIYIIQNIAFRSFFRAINTRTFENIDYRRFFLKK